MCGDARYDTTHDDDGALVRRNYILERPLTLPIVLFLVSAQMGMYRLPEESGKPMILTPKGRQSPRRGACTDPAERPEGFQECLATLVAKAAHTVESSGCHLSRQTKHQTPLSPPE
jgi:hypothetical protein